jgi:hypothetical protein
MAENIYTINCSFSKYRPLKNEGKKISIEVNISNVIFKILFIFSLLASILAVLFIYDLPSSPNWKNSIDFY